MRFCWSTAAQAAAPRLPVDPAEAAAIAARFGIEGYAAETEQELYDRELAERREAAAALAAGEGSPMN